MYIVPYGTVCGRYRQGNTARVADLRLGGLWLKGTGFGIGQKFEIRVENRGTLTIRAIDRHPQRGRRVTGGSSTSDGARELQGRRNSTSDASRGL